MHTSVALRGDSTGTLVVRIDGALLCISNAWTKMTRLVMGFLQPEQRGIFQPPHYMTFLIPRAAMKHTPQSSAADDS